MTQTTLPQEAAARAGGRGVLAIASFARRLPRPGASLLLLLPVILLSAGPVLYVLVSSFQTGGPHGGGFGLGAWSRILGDGGLRQSILNSFILTLRVPFGLAVAFLTAWLLIRVRVPGRHFIELCLWFGFFLPTVPILTGWILLLDEHFGAANWLLQATGLATGPVFTIHSLAGILWAHLSLHTVPIMTILLAPALRQFDAELEKAAAIHGANHAKTLRYVVLPILAPALLVAGVASLIKSLESFEVEQILGVPAGIDVYSTSIYSMINRDPPDFPAAMALSSLFLVLLVGLATVHRGWFSAAGTMASDGRRAAYIRHYPDWLRWTGSTVLVILVVVSILLPFAALIAGSFMRLFGFFDLPGAWTLEHWATVLTDPLFGRAAVNSVVLGIVAGGVGSVLFAGIGWLLARTNFRWRGFVSFLIWLPWAVPGIVLGVVLLDLSLNTPLLSAFHGTIVPVVLALFIKELPIGVQLMRVAVGQIPVSLEQAGHISGAGRFNVLARITFPLLLPAFLAVFLLVFGAAIRDISTIVLVAPPGMQTMSLLMFRYAGVSDLEAASVVGTIVAVISLLLAIAARRFALHGERWQ